MIVSQRSQPARLASILLLLGVALAIYVASAARPALLDDADGCHALAAQEILQRGDWAILYVNGIRWMEKAPFHYWLVAAGYSLFGQSAFTTRLPVALAMVFLTLLLYEFGRRFFGERAGLYAGLVMATSAGSFLFTRIMIPEGIYALQFTAAFYLFLRAWTGSLPARTGWWGFAALVGLASITRAGIGVLFPVAIVALFLLAAGAARRGSDARKQLAAAPLASTVLITLLISVPWHVLASVRAPGFLWFYFINEQVLRALGKRYPPDYTAVPLWLWWAAHLVWFFPWSVFVPYAWRRMTAVRMRATAWDAATSARVFLTIWAAVILGFFTIVTGSRMEYYAFGAWPALALLLGTGLARAEEGNDAWLGRLHVMLAGIGVLAAITLGTLLWISRDVSGATDISTLLTRHDTDFYRVSMATLFDLTPQAFGALRTPAALAAVVLATGTLMGWAFRRNGRHRAATLAVATMMVAFLAAANLAFEAFEPRLSSRPLADAVRNSMSAEDRLIVYGEFEQACSFSFYTGRSAMIYRGRYNGLEFGSHYPDAPPIFLGDREFAEAWNSRGPGRVFLFVPPDQRQSATATIPALDSQLFLEIGGKALYVNRPFPTD